MMLKINNQKTYDDVEYHLNGQTNELIIYVHDPKRLPEIAADFDQVSVFEFFTEDGKTLDRFEGYNFLFQLIKDPMVTMAVIRKEEIADG